MCVEGRAGRIYKGSDMEQEEKTGIKVDFEFWCEQLERQNCYKAGRWQESLGCKLNNLLGLRWEMLKRSRAVCIWTPKERTEPEMSACKLSGSIDISKAWTQMRQTTRGEMTKSWSILNCGGQRDTGSSKGCWVARSQENQREQEQVKQVLEAGGSDDPCPVSRLGKTG